MADGDGPSGQDWECGWESHRRAQALRLARLPLSEKLAWLEQAHGLMLHLARSRARLHPRTGAA